MEGKEQFEKLLIAFILGELTEEQEVGVKERINSDPQIKELYEQLCKTVKLVGFKHTIDNVDIDKEWLTFEKDRIRREYPEIFEIEAERFGNEVIKEVGLKRKNKVFRIVSIIAVAASLVFAIGWGLSLINDNKVPGETVAVTKQNKAPMVASVKRNFSNKTKVGQTYFLQDGTEVILAANSEISFQDPFDADKRDIRLSGSARFNVARDKTKPFTVFSEGISTTALGTSFTVTAYKTSGRIKVVLHEGRIVVKGVGQLKEKLKKSFYLVPGQEFVFEKNKPGAIAIVVNSSASTVKNRQMPGSGSNIDVAVDDPSIPKYGKGTWYMFNNERLESVLDQLAAMYKTRIIYSKTDVAKIYFIGTFNKTDSLEGVLKQIALANNLKVSKENNGFLIKK